MNYTSSYQCGQQKLSAITETLGAAATRCPGRASRILQGALPACLPAVSSITVEGVHTPQMEVVAITVFGISTRLQVELYRGPEFRFLPNFQNGVRWLVLGRAPRTSRAV